MATLRTSKAVPPTQRPINAKDVKTITHERLSKDLDAFMKAGGEIERLGATQTLKKIT